MSGTSKKKCCCEPGGFEFCSEVNATQCPTCPDTYLVDIGQMIHGSNVDPDQCNFPGGGFTLDRAAPSPNECRWFCQGPFGGVCPVDATDQGDVCELSFIELRCGLSRWEVQIHWTFTVFGNFFVCTATYFRPGLPACPEVGPYAFEGGCLNTQFPATIELS